MQGPTSGTQSSIGSDAGHHMLILHVRNSMFVCLSFVHLLDRASGLPIVDGAGKFASWRHDLWVQCMLNSNYDAVMKARSPFYPAHSDGVLTGCRLCSSAGRSASFGDLIHVVKPSMCVLLILRCCLLGEWVCTKQGWYFDAASQWMQPFTKTQLLFAKHLSHQHLRPT